MSPEALAFSLLLSVMMRSITRNSGNRAARRRQPRAAVAMLVMEASLHAQAALYPTLTPKAGLLLPQEHVCHRDTLVLQRALKSRTVWAERMADASARGVVGGLWGARFQLGSFDACLSAGQVSPVGARYCLAQLSASAQLGGSRTQSQSHIRPHFRNRYLPPSPCSAEPTAAGQPTSWDEVQGVDPQSDALLALQGCGLAPGSIPLSEVRVALCVPESCDHAALQEALAAALQRSASAFEVRLDEDDCVGYQELHAGPPDVPATLFWIFVACLSVGVVLAPSRGETAAQVAHLDHSQPDSEGRSPTLPPSFSHSRGTAMPSTGYGHG
ncbi:Sal-like protein 4 [Frankliniella fusca]|uniref:Sal-like protein 4 n=1 Tax=Frankliniella fusca TaxID=407009 RepID=A0AAE1L9B4_9NEOP|nr:Sal-like protein 4 [Frankliniella fusca]